MNYVEIETGDIVNIYAIKRKNPNISFPVAGLPDGWLKDKGYATFEENDPSGDDIVRQEKTEKAARDNGVWRRVWNVTRLTAAQKKAAAKQALHDLNYDLREQVIADGPSVDFNDDLTINPPSDTRTMVLFAALKDAAIADSDFVYSGYRARNGTFDLTAAQILALYQAGFNHVAATFAKYTANDLAINAGTMDTETKVQTAYGQ